MADEHKSPGSELVVRPNYDVQLREFEKGLLGFLESHALPTESILVGVSERGVVFNNIEGVLARINKDQLQRSVYISKYAAAVASGLFDAALNYLWDETISELRRRVAQYDLSYFFDNAVSSQEKRKNLSAADDLVKIDDSELILGAKEIGLISELGYKHLDHIRYMRNWASAAHPNQNQITGLQLISWLETCIKEVISLPLSSIAVEIKKLLSNVKSNSISDREAKEVAAFFLNLTQEQVNNLASGFFGIYVRADTTPQTRENVHRLLPLLWDRVDEPTRQHFGIKLGKFVANNDQAEKNLARQFLELVSATSYIPDDLRAVEIKTALENLLSAHRGFNNFHNEPVFARQLKLLVGEGRAAPPQVKSDYVLALVEVLLTNGNGTAWNAEPDYKSMINQFDQTQALIAILSFTSSIISSRLQFELCQKKFRELLEMMKVKVSAAALKELIDDIEAFKAPFDKLKDDSRIKQRIANLRKIIR